MWILDTWYLIFNLQYKCRRQNTTYKYLYSQKNPYTFLIGQALLNRQEFVLYLDKIFSRLLVTKKIFEFKQTPFTL